MRWWESAVRFLSARSGRVFKLRGVLELELHSLPLWLSVSANYQKVEPAARGVAK